MPHPISDFVPGQPLHVRLYGRQGCTLCQDAALVLQQLHSDFDFWVEKIDIDQDPAIKEKLLEQVPVVTINGGNRVGGRISEDRLRRAFHRATLQEEEELPAEAVEA